MLRLTLLDGRSVEMPREEVLALLPCDRLFRNPNVKSDALYCHEGRLLPVKGPLPELGGESGPDLTVEQRPWLLLRADGVQVVRGLPRFADESKVSIVPTSAAPVAPVLVIPPRPSVVISAPALNEADEEARLMAELEDLLESA